MGLSLSWNLAGGSAFAGRIDIDLILFSPSFSGMPHWRRWEVLGKAIAQVRKPVEALAYAPEEIERLREARATLVRHILLQPETVEYHVQ